MVFQFDLLAMSISQLPCQCYLTSVLFPLNPDLAALLHHISTCACCPLILHSIQTAISAKLRNGETVRDRIEQWHGLRGPGHQADGAIAQDTLLLVGWVVLGRSFLSLWASVPSVVNQVLGSVISGLTAGLWSPAQLSPALPLTEEVGSGWEAARWRGCGGVQLRLPASGQAVVAE